MSEKLKMQTKNIADKNFAKLAELFPNAVTETVDEEGNVVRAIDKDILQQEINATVVEDREERYQFTWPEKKKAIAEANRPINKTLRPCREESVDFDNTENLYIEGDNLEVLKLLQETYLGKVKMIYIDPPYNTGHDMVYQDDFAQNAEEYAENSGQKDEEGNRLFQNTESNGRFHTDWLNMMYPRLKLAKNLLTDDGVIFISIDDNEVDNLKKICDEVFGESNFISTISILSNPRGRQSSAFVAATHEYVLIYARDYSQCVINGLDLTEEQKKEYSLEDEYGQYRLLGLRLRGGRATAEESPTLHFPIYYSKGEDDFYLTKKNDDDYEIVPKFEDGTLGTWRWSKEKILKNKRELVVKPVKDRYDVFQKDYLSKFKKMKAKSLWDEKEINYDRSANELKGLFGSKVFDYAKPLYLSEKILKLGMSLDGVVLDFFSGSATTAHAVMQLNAEDGGHRKFIMVQLPEKCDAKSEAFKAGYKNICEIGKERIRRAAKFIREANAPFWGKQDDSFWGKPEEDFWGKNADKAPKFDGGFRVLKVDSSNMEDVYYTPNKTEQGKLDMFAENVKVDRTAEDLLFQVMLDLGVELSSKIVKAKVEGKEVFNVADGFLIACFDNGLDEKVITAIAKQKPQYFVTRDSSIAGDDVFTNFEQLFTTYSPDTNRKVL